MRTDKSATSRKSGRTQLARLLGFVFFETFGGEAMPWSLEHYPKSMVNLPDDVRLKAIEMANALLAEGMEEGKAVRIAIAKAKEWAQHHRWPVE
jgi:uncharacterized protein YoaH (UPF0181 family)